MTHFYITYICPLHHSAVILMSCCCDFPLPEGSIGGSTFRQNSLRIFQPPNAFLIPFFINKNAEYFWTLNFLNIADPQNGVLPKYV